MPSLQFLLTYGDRVADGDDDDDGDGDDGVYIDNLPREAWQSRNLLLSPNSLSNGVVIRQNKVNEKESLVHHARAFFFKIFCKICFFVLFFTLIPSHIICALSGSLTLRISLRMPTVATSIVSSRGCSNLSPVPLSPSLPHAESVLYLHPPRRDEIFVTFLRLFGPCKARV